MKFSNSTPPKGFNELAPRASKSIQEDILPSLFEFESSKRLTAAQLLESSYLTQ